MNLHLNANRLSPVQAAFIGSLVLSLIAVLSNPTINRDGILYVETARIFLQDGFSASLKSFNWPFLPILMAVVSKLTGLGLEIAGRLLNAFLMAGACALTVSIARQKNPEIAWSTCLVVLALPGLNHYREELLREYGCWFFVTLSFWIALRWSDNPRWRTALLAQLALCMASLFRPEAVAFFAALFFWQLHTAPKGERLRRSAMISSLPAIGVLGLIALSLSEQFPLSSRIKNLIDLINPAKKTALFDIKANALAAALTPYARDQAGSILLSGSLAIIPIKFIKQLGLFLLPLAIALHRKKLSLFLALSPLLAWALFAHLIVLSAFVIDMQFLAGRYVAVLSLLASPFIGYAVRDTLLRFPRVKVPLLSICLIVMLGNVASFRPGSMHFKQAGEWLALNSKEVQTQYIDSVRTAYYAGQSLQDVKSPEQRPDFTSAISQGHYQLVVLEISHHDTEIGSWLTKNNLRIVQKFSSPRNGSIIIARREEAL